MVKYIMIFFLIQYSYLVFSQETKLSESVISIAEELAADDTDPEAVSRRRLKGPGTPLQGEWRLQLWRVTLFENAGGDPAQPGKAH